MKALRLFWIPALAASAVAVSFCGGGSGSNDGSGNTGGNDAGASDAGSGADAGSPDAGTDGGVTPGKPTTLAAKAVGAYAQIGSYCSSGSKLTGYAMFLCPGARIRGAGVFDGLTNVFCGSYTATAASMPGCTDKVGCFDKVHATVKDTLYAGGQQDVDPAMKFDMLMVEKTSEFQLWRLTACKDGSTEYMVLKRIAGDVSGDYCVSSYCSSTTSGQCGTDCDCGRCWYCEKSGSTGTCRYGGEGPYGCYRGCGG